MMLKSGIAPLDDRIGGLVAGRQYVLTGAPGTGKSVACLEFLTAGLDEGGSVALLTNDDPSDILAQGAFLGLDLGTAIADNRCVMLRYQLDFARRFGRAETPDTAYDELRHLLGTTAPRRIVIDSVTPIIEAGTASGAAISGLLRFLDELGATALLTYPGDLAGRYDRRLETLAQRAAGIFHFTAERDRSGTIEIRKVRFPVPSTAPVAFSIQPGVGIGAAGSGQSRRSYDLPEETRRKVLVLSEHDHFAGELLQSLRTQFDVSVRTHVESAFAQLAQSQAGVVLLDVRRDTLERTLALVRELRRAGSHSPIALVTAFTLRANDRARALRAGADDFFVGLHPEEFLLRVEGLAARGRSAAVSSPEPATAGSDGERVLDEEEFRSAVQARLATDVVAFFTVVRLTPVTAPGAPDAHGAEQLAEIARGQMRADGEDLVGTLDGDAVVYLHSARRKDVEPFVLRVREAWRTAGGGELETATASAPAEERELHALLASRQHA